MSYDDFKTQMDSIRKEFEYDDSLMALEIKRLRNALDRIQHMNKGE